ncbi:methionine adenosyltransferase [Acidobacteriota bacterium]
MNKNNYLFTSESVAEGHPDKLCDQISDAVLDAILAKSSNPKLVHGAIETLATTQHLTLAGEFRVCEPKEIPDFETIVRGVIKDIGFDKPHYKFDNNSCKIINNLHGQSENIREMVDNGGAGDQGLMFGYAVDETPELMPLPIQMAHKLVERMDYARREKLIDCLKPDGKSQVTIRYEKGQPAAVEKVVLAVPFDKKIEKSTVKHNLFEVVVSPVIEKYGCEYKAQLEGLEPNFIVNGKGDWENGGPDSDTGLTGRKIIVDTYGGMGRHGGGCFSGKDPSKVDRSASYMARYIAKNIVAAGLAKRCEIQLAYVIGVSDPVSVLIETFETGLVPDHALEEGVKELFDLTPRRIIEQLDLIRPIFRKTSFYGHFGRELDDFTWEKTDRAADLKSHFNI